MNLKKRLANIANLFLNPMGVQILPYSRPGKEYTGSSIQSKVQRNPNYPIFRDSKWHYAFELSDGTLTPTYVDSLQEWHEIRRQFIFSRIDSVIGPLEGKSCLDIACNSGFWSIELAKRGAVVKAFDKSASEINKARAIT